MPQPTHQPSSHGERPQTSVRSVQPTSAETWRESEGWFAGEAVAHGVAGPFRKPGLGAPAGNRQTILDLQRIVGNAAVQRHLGRAVVPAGPLIERAPVPFVQREPTPQPSLPIPGTGVTVEPGELKPGILGSPIPLPSSLRVRKPPGTGRGAALTAPSFELRIDPTIMVGGILDGIDLGGFTLVNPTVVFNPKSNTLTGVATLSIPSSAYPPQFVAPTEIEARFTSSSLGSFQVEGGLGPFVGELTLSIEYGGIESLKALKAAILRGDVGEGAEQLATLPTNARFKASGHLGVGTQKYHLPLAGGLASGEVNEKGVSWGGGTAGALVVPKGTFREDIDVPGAGVQGQLGKQSWSGERAVTSAMASVTGTPSIAAATKGDWGKVFPPFLYAQVAHTTRNAKGHVLGIRLSGHLRLGGEAEPADVREQAGEALQQSRYRQGGDAQNRPNIDPVVTNKWEDLTAGGRDEKWRGGIEVFGTFDVLGGK